MAQVTIFTTVDAFNNNISGFYDTETFLLAGTSSSSDATQNDALLKFTTVGAGIGALDTINSATLYMYLSAWSDPGGVGTLLVYGDVNNVWGVLDAFDPPSVAIGFGTVNEGAMAAGVGWQSRTLNVTGGNSIPKAAQFNIGIDCIASDSFTVQATFDSIENTNARSPYPAGTGHSDGRAFIVIDYTPAVTVGSSPTQIMFGN